MDEVYKGIRQAADPAHLTELESVHVPVIEAPGTVPAGDMLSITVKVGRRPHPIEPTHHIQFVDLYADYTLVSRTTFTPAISLPKVNLSLILFESVALRAIAFCNLHGSWESTVQVKVEQAPA